MVMVKTGKTDKELWQALDRLDDDLLAPDLPEAILDEELRAMKVDPAALAKRGIDFVAKLKEEERLTWQVRARERLARLEASASKVIVPPDLDKDAVIARLEQLRATDPKIGTAIKMAARKRKPEESSVEELRALLEEMEALRSIEGDDPE
jgi:hypothetical protein